MPRPKSAFDDVRPFEFREPAEVLDAGTMYTVYEIARLLQGIEPDRELDAGTEGILLDWAIPWMLDHESSFVFAEPADEDAPGFYGLREGVAADDATADDCSGVEGTAADAGE